MESNRANAPDTQLQPKLITYATYAATCRKSLGVLAGLETAQKEHIVTHRHSHCCSLKNGKSLRHQRRCSQAATSHRRSCSQAVAPHQRHCVLRTQRRWTCKSHQRHCFQAAAAHQPRCSQAATAAAPYPALSSSGAQHMPTASSLALLSFHAKHVLDAFLQPTRNAQYLPTRGQPPRASAYCRLRPGRHWVLEAAARGVVLKLCRLSQPTCNAQFPPKLPPDRRPCRPAHTGRKF